MEPAIAGWWFRLFAAAVASDLEPLDLTRDLYADLISTAGGRLTQAALTDLESQRLAGKVVDPQLLAAIATAAGALGRQGAMARGALVYAAEFVLTFDGQQVIPLLDKALAGDDDEGVALRRVLVTDASISSITSKAFSAHILRGLNELTGRGHDLTNAAAKIIAPALSIVRGDQTEEEWGMTVAQVAQALRTGPPELRLGAAELVKKWIHQIDEDRAVGWRKGIGLLLLAVWPRERKFRVQELSRPFADLAVASGEAFPEALTQLLPLMSLIEGHGGTFAIEKSDAPEQFPRETLVLLWKLFGPGTTSDLHGVPNILDRLVVALPQIELDRRLQWLDQKATRYE